MREKYPRRALRTDHVYYCQKSGKYFWTPDCIGVYWFTTAEEALEEAYGPVIHIWDLED